MTGYEELPDSPTGKLSDETLAQQAKTGDERAMRLLVHRLTDPIWRFLHHRGATEIEAEEITAETLETVLTHINQFEGRGRLYSWACSIAWHRLLRHRAKFRPEFVPLDDCYKIPGDAGLEPEEACRRREQIRICHELLSRLTPRQRHAITLVELEGMSLKEAAAVLNSTDKAVSMLLDRAKRRLRTIARRKYPAILLEKDHAQD